MRLASLAAFAPMRTPSNATTPNRTMPNCAHSCNEAVSRSANAASWTLRKLARTVWSGMSEAQMIRNATSVAHSRSICRDERSPCAIA